MSSTVSPFNQTLDYFRGLIQFFQGNDSSSNNKRTDLKGLNVHRYRQTPDCYSFTLEPAGKNTLRFYMTGFGTDIQQGDFIVIEVKASTMTYRVESIDYYLDPPDMWMASLLKCSYSFDDFRALLT